MRKIIPAIFFVMSLVVVIVSDYLKPNKYLGTESPINIAKVIPAQFGDWSSTDNSSSIVQNPELSQLVNSIYSQVINRVYVNNKTGTRIMLSVAYTENQSDDSKQQSHKPDICYPAQGFTLTNRENISIDFGDHHLSAKQMVATLNERIEPMIYWTMHGKYSANNIFESKKAQLLYSKEGIIPDGLIFRVSYISDNIKTDFSELTLFINEMKKYSATQQERIFGV